MPIKPIPSNNRVHSQISQIEKEIDKFNRNICKKVSERDFGLSAKKQNQCFTTKKASEKAETTMKQLMSDMM